MEKQMKTTSNDSTAEINHEYIELYVWSCRMVRVIENAFGGDTQIYLPEKFFEMAFDCLGVPKDNTRDFDRPTCENPYYPEGCYCRDWAYDLFHELVYEDNLTSEEIVARFKHEVEQ